jgi:hypothetical protein
MIGSCPACYSLIKAERGEIKTAYGASVICTDNWHWVTAPVISAPKGWDWTPDDDRFLWQLDLAFQKSAKEIETEYKYLRI